MHAASLADRMRSEQPGMRHVGHSHSAIEPSVKMSLALLKQMRSPTTVQTTVATDRALAAVRGSQRDVVRASLA